MAILAVALPFIFLFFKLKKNVQYKRKTGVGNLAKKR
jgi:hypothetical protein